MNAMEPAFGSAIFCDDIRYEEGGKQTLVGAYANAIFLHGDFPFVLPKFAIAIRYSERLDVFGKHRVQLKVFLPGADDPAIEGELPVVQASKNLDQTPFLRPDLPAPEHAHLGFSIMFAPLTLAGEGEIRVEALRDGEMIRLGKLRVLKAGSSANAPAKRETTQ